MPTPELSVIIPAYNRGAVLAQTLDNLEAASPPVTWEVLVVDDGSTENLAALTEEAASRLPLRWSRQENSGSIRARLHGLAEANGEYVLFLDSDDRVHPDKLARQLNELRHTDSDLCYTDGGVWDLEQNSSDSQKDWTLPAPASFRDSASLILQVQPPPHTFMYRRSYLLSALQDTVVPEHRYFHPVGDTWLYYNLCLHPARFCKVSGALTLIGHHEGSRLSDHWESLAFPSLLLMRIFMQNCPAEAQEVKKRVGEIAFHTWRGLPHDAPAPLLRDTESLWRSVHPTDNLGGRYFTFAVRLLGLKTAGLLFRLWQAPSYQRAGTLSPEQSINMTTEYARVAGELLPCPQ